MADKSVLLNALQAALASALPSRIVTRSFKDFGMRSAAELNSGVVTLLSHGTGKYGGVKGRFGTPGELTLLLTGQIQVAENATTQDVEDAELTLLEQIELFCAAPPAPLGNLVIEAARQSGQIEHPYGWIACDLRLYL